MITVNGDRVAYRDEGSGQVLLLIHGLGSSSYGWRGVMPKLSQKYRVIAPDLPGHGHSDKLRAGYSLASFAV
jgi:pimeloyl-ACP methyl ester carboxylesterase